MHGPNRVVQLLALFAATAAVFVIPALAISQRTPQETKKTLKAQGTAQLSGKVTDPEGKPAGFIEVTLMADDPASIEIPRRLILTSQKRTEPTPSRIFLPVPICWASTSPSHPARDSHTRACITPLRPYVFRPNRSKSPKASSLPISISTCLGR